MSAKQPKQHPLHKIGKEIFRTHDDHGPIVVLQNGDRRVLTFGNEIGQSSVSVANPARLEYSYTQAMFMATLLVPELRTALVLGTGGGSLVRALGAGFPDCSVTAVEGRAQVDRVARDYLFLVDAPNIQLVIADAVDHLAAAPEQYSLIFADLYRAEGMDARQTQLEFLHNCRAALVPGGVLTANFWSGEIQAMQQTLNSCSRIFERRLLQLPVRSGNHIIFGFSERLPVLKRKALYQKAEELGSKLDIPLHKLARNLWRQNAEALQVGRYQR